MALQTKVEMILKSEVFPFCSNIKLTAHAAMAMPMNIKPKVKACIENQLVPSDILASRCTLPKRFRKKMWCKTSRKKIPKHSTRQVNKTA